MEKWSKIIYFGIAKVLPICIVLPKMVISFALYFASDDSENDVFILPFPAWWVCQFFSKIQAEPNDSPKISLVIFKVSVRLAKSSWIFDSRYYWVLFRNLQILIYREHGCSWLNKSFSGYCRVEWREIQLKFDHWKY